MANKRKPTKKHNPNQVTVHAEHDKDAALAKARKVLRPTVQAALTLQEYGKTFGKTDLRGLVDNLAEQTEATNKGDLKRGVEMLTAQAHTLDAIFNNIARRAINTDLLDKFDKYLKLSLRAQSQCRATWEAISSIKNPPVAGYINQANIAHGPQQINNGTTQVTPAPRENENVKNELLEEQDGERLDTRTTSTPSSVDSEMETVETINRPKNK